MKSLSPFIFLFLFSISQSTLSAQETFPGLIGAGIGLHQWNRPFVDIMKNSRGFEALAGGDVAMDANGWPLTDAKLVLLEAWPVAEWFGNIDDPEEFHMDLSGVYRCSFTGQANVVADFGDFSLQNISYNVGSNTTTFEIVIPPNANGVVILRFENTRRLPASPLNSGITSLRAIRPGYALNTAQVFNADFLNGLQAACFSTFRFMGFSETNNNNPSYPGVTNWANRKLPQSATYHETNDAVPAGTPWELIVELGNILQKDIWINVPVSATDDYITQLATLIRDNLDPGLHVYVEYSNEVWNWAFWQAHWNSDKGQSQGLNYIEAYAKRTAEIALLFKSVFGENSLNNRVRVINCWQIGWWPPDWQMREQMEYIKANFQEPNTLIYALGVAPYFNCGNVCSTGTPSQIISAMYASSDASVTARQLVAQLAADWSLPGSMVSYEGGSDTGGGDPANVENRIIAERSEAMKDLMIHDLKDNWFPHGGQLFMYLDICSSYNRYGSWGLTDDITNPDRNFKFEAVRTLLGDEPCLTTSTEEPVTVFSKVTVSPNPSNGEFSISFSLEKQDEVTVTVFDLPGWQVAKTDFGQLGAGTHRLPLNLKNRKGFFQLMISGANSRSITRVIIF